MMMMMMMMMTQNKSGRSGGEKQIITHDQPNNPTPVEGQEIFPIKGSFPWGGLPSYQLRLHLSSSSSAAKTYGTVHIQWRTYLSDSLKHNGEHLWLIDG